MRQNRQEQEARKCQLTYRPPPTANDVTSTMGTAGLGAGAFDASQAITIGDGSFQCGGCGATAA
jgi:hypothetical protein